MATTDARPVPRKNTAFRLYFAIRKNDGTLITTWAGQDSEVSKDGGSFADCTSEATEIGTSGCGYLELTASEMNADAVILKITVTNTDALPIVMTFFPEEQGDYRVGAVALDSAVGTQINKIEAAVAGTVTGAGTATEIFVGPSATLTITVDSSGNRSAVVVT